MQPALIANLRPSLQIQMEQTSEGVHADRHSVVYQVLRAVNIAASLDLEGAALFQAQRPQVLPLEVKQWVVPQHDGTCCVRELWAVAGQD